MDWRIKGGIQSFLSRLPGGASINDLLQQIVGGRRDLGAEVDMKFSEDWLVQMQALRETGLCIAGRDLVEIGTGWLPVFPICFHLSGARHCHTYDVTRHLRSQAVRSTLRALEKHLGTLADAADQPHDRVRDRWRELMDVEDDGALLERAGIVYHAPADAAQTSLDDRSVALVFSNSVLEHVTPEALSTLMQEAQRILEPGALALHSVNCGDHYAYFDASITPIHYLRYSDRQWRRWNNDLLYQNRLRPVDFTKAALGAGMEIRLDWHRPREELLAIIDTLPIAEEFGRYPSEQLCCTSITFAATPGVPDGVAETTSQTRRALARKNPLESSMSRVVLQSTGVLLATLFSVACGGGGESASTTAAAESPSPSAAPAPAPSPGPAPGQPPAPAPAAPAPAPAPAPSPAPPPPPGTTFGLTVVASGQGRIVSTPSGIDCGSDCNQAYASGTAVSLSPSASPGYVFAGWSGACTGTLACAVTLTQARSVTATFQAAQASTGCNVPRGNAAAPTIAATHPKIYLNHAATKACLQQLLANGVPSATRFKNMVDAQLAGGNIYDFQPWYAALLYQLTGDVRYANYAVQRTEAFVAAEEALIAANQRATVAADSYLEVGPKIGNVALVYDWCYDRLTAGQRTRWTTYANQAVSNVWNPNTARWGNTVYPWSGWSIDNPSNNYYYSFLRATMSLGLATHGENAQAQAWIDRFRTDKIENQLMVVFNRDLEGGGSREGTGYGTAMKNLWQLYDWWERSTGERIATRTPHTLASIAHLIHSLAPTLDRLAPTGDHARDSSAELFDYHREYLLELIALFPQERLSSAAKLLLDASSVPRMQNSFEYFADFLYEPPPLPAARLDDLSTTYWGNGTGQLMMRTDWTTGAAYSNFICGPYTESHAHHDQGSFVVYRGSWLAYDSNIVSASGIEQGEEMHNLVRIEQSGSTVRQVEGSPRCILRALADNAHFTYAVADVTPIYNGKAAVSKVEREFLFIRPSTFVVFDRVVTAANARRVWTLNLPAAATLNGDRISYVNGAARLDVHRLAPTGLASQWIAGQRVEVADTAGTESLFLNVLGTNNSVSAAVRSDSAGSTGVQVTLADGRVAIVRFSNSGPGATLDLRRPAGTIDFNGPLPSTVTVPPLFRN